MRSLSRVERFFERLVERPSARLFHPRLQPVQILRRIERAMEAGQQSVAGRTVAPNQFSVAIHPDDLESLEPLDDVAADLASDALAFARTRQLALSDRPRVAIRPDPGVRHGEVEVEATISAPVAADGDDVGSGTRIFEFPIPRAPAAALEVREPGRISRRVTLEGPIRIGRSAECELVLRDSRVSRQHARLHARDGVLVLTDLGSTNGTLVNDQRVREVVLGSGDRITIGETVLIVGASPDGGGRATG
jgi:pSer/pThr/pTyr-binding forkhead associated (FHA) protein